MNQPTNQPIRISQSPGRWCPYVYAILDGARNRKIQPMLKSYGVKHYCLFDYELDYSLTLAAPYMMRLEEDSDFTRDLIQQAWGNSWGIFAIAPTTTSLIRVRFNCKDIFFVRSEQGQKMLFRFYDPRVMRVFLPACTKQESLADAFEHISHYVMEDETACALHRFTLEKKQGLLQLKSTFTPLFDKQNTSIMEPLS